MDSEQIVIDSSLPDRISDLPNNIITDCILDRIPIHDVVATSILSKGWRHKWRRIPNLVFDEKFKYRVIEARRLGSGNARVKLVEYSNIIGKILLLHLGPIHKFVLHVPHVWNGLPPDLCSWMLFVSQNEIKELTIQARNVSIVRLPSHVFQCNELQHLKLDLERFYLHPPPQDFRGFCNLLSLDLSCILDGGESEISNLVSKCTLLERLSLNCLACTHPLVIDAPRLLFLHAYCSLNAFLKLKNVCSLTTISLQFSSPGRLNLCDLFDVFGSVPKVETVTLRMIKAMPQDAPTSFPTTLHNHQSLTLLAIDISSPQCIYFVLCILKSSPNLQKLNLGILSSETVEDEAALHLLEMETRETQTLNSLLTIKMKGILGSKVGIMFVKMILSCSPVLKTMYLTGFYDHDSYMERNILILNEAEVTLMSELLKFPRSSCRAQVIYSA